MPEIIYKEIESNIFEIKVGQLILENSEDIKYLNTIRDSYFNYDLIDIRIPYNLMRYIKHIQILKNVIFVGAIVTYELDINSIKNRNIYVTNNCRLASQDDLEDCIRITKQSFVEIEDGINRFNLDPHFDKDKIEKYYLEWIKNCFNKTSADEVIIYKYKEIIKGFASIKKIDNDIYNIPLNAVDRASRQKGIYRDTINWIIDKLDGKINTRAYLGNIAAQKVWLGMGAEIKNIDMVFHKYMYGVK